jgi:hypothetical protein
MQHILQSTRTFTIKITIKKNNPIHSNACDDLFMKVSGLPLIAHS